MIYLHSCDILRFPEVFCWVKGRGLCVCLIQTSEQQEMVRDSLFAFISQHPHK